MIPCHSRTLPQVPNAIASASIVLSAIPAEAVRWRLQSSEVRNRTCVRPRLQSFPRRTGPIQVPRYRGSQLSPATSQLASRVELPTRCLLLASHEKAPLEDFPSLERNGNMRYSAEVQIGAFPDFV